MPGRLQENDDRVVDLWMSNEVHFRLSVFMNEQDFGNWSDATLRETPLHSQIVTIRFAVSTNGTIGPFSSCTRLKMWSPLTRPFLSEWRYIFFIKPNGENVDESCECSVLGPHHFTERERLPRFPDLTACNFFFYTGNLNQKCLRVIHRELTKPSNNAFGTRLKQYPVISREKWRKTFIFDYENSIHSMDVIWQSLRI